MKLFNIVFVISCFSVTVRSQVINRVRLVDHTSYAIDVITKTVNTIEERGWHSLKLPDFVQHVNESLLTAPVVGKLTYRNGFVNSVQHVDIRRDTVQQVWAYSAAADQTTVTVRGTLRMHEVAIGYDVTTELDGDSKPYHHSITFVHPMITYAFSIIHDAYRGTNDVTVLGTVTRVTNRLPSFKPQDSLTDILTHVFDPNTDIPTAMVAWGPEVFQPITLKLVTEEIPFPQFCYNCAT
uniref:SFRICE_024221 n=1 Tax=Spodoptera frugiperda TaxID=7108 RepID=A0A2H1WNY9_SPOFR